MIHLMLSLQNLVQERDSKGLSYQRVQIALPNVLIFAAGAVDGWDSGVHADGERPADAGAAEVDAAERHLGRQDPNARQGRSCSPALHQHRHRRPAA